MQPPLPQRLPTRNEIFVSVTHLARLFSCRPNIRPPFAFCINPSSVNLFLRREKAALIFFACFLPQRSVKWGSCALKSAGAAPHLRNFVRTTTHDQLLCGPSFTAPLLSLTMGSDLTIANKVPGSHTCPLLRRLRLPRSCLPLGYKGVHKSNIYGAVRIYRPYLHQSIALNESRSYRSTCRRSFVPRSVYCDLDFWTGVWCSGGWNRARGGLCHC